MLVKYATLSSVDLGKAERGLPQSLKISDLRNFDESYDLAQVLLESNTFFHGKVGFYEKLIKKIFETAGRKSESLDYLFTVRSLQRKELPTPLLLLPKVKSEEVLNDFVAQCLRHRSNRPVWLVVQPLSIYKHLLLGFHNFFIISNNKEEIDYLKNVLNFDEQTYELLIFNNVVPIFITDYEPIVNRTKGQIVSFLLEGLKE